MAAGPVGVALDLRLSPPAGTLAGMDPQGRMPEEIDIPEDDDPGGTAQPWQDPGVYDDEDQPDDADAGDPDAPEVPDPDTGL